MKTKITFVAALLCALIFAPSVLADTEEGFYEKNHIRGFISLGGDYRGMFKEFRNYVNQVAFGNGYHVVEDGDSTELYAGKINYAKFDDYYLGLHLNIGAQYKQFLTWFDINFMPTQISERPHSTYTTTSESGTSIKFPLYDVRWFCYGADWMFGWKLFGEDMPVNLIPAVGTMTAPTPASATATTAPSPPRSTPNSNSAWKSASSPSVSTAATAPCVTTNLTSKATTSKPRSASTIPTTSAIPGSSVCASPGFS